MKKIALSIIILISQANTQTLNTDLIYDAMGDGIIQLGEGVAKSTGNLIRRATNTRTEEEKCNSAWWDYFKKSNHIIATTEKENTQMKLLLYKNKINYDTILRQRVHNIRIDENELREQSCSEEYFEQLVRQEKRIKEVKRENDVLKEMIILNGIEKKEVKYYKVEEKKPKLNMIITENKNMDEEMKKAMEDVN